MSKKTIVIGLILGVALGGGVLYRFTHLKSGGEHAEHKEAGHKEEKVVAMKKARDIRKRKEAMKVTTNMEDMARLAVSK